MSARQAGRWRFPHYEFLRERVREVSRDPSRELAALGPWPEWVIPALRTRLEETNPRPLTEGQAEGAFDLCHALHRRGTLVECADAYAIYLQSIESRGLIDRRSQPSTDLLSAKIDFARCRRAEILIELRRFEEAESELVRAQNQLDERFPPAARGDWNYTFGTEHIARVRKKREVGMARPRGSGVAFELSPADGRAPRHLANVLRRARVGRAEEWARRLDAAFDDYSLVSGARPGSRSPEPTREGFDFLLGEWDLLLAASASQKQLHDWMADLAFDLAVFEATRGAGDGNRGPDEEFERLRAGFEIQALSVAYWEGRPVFVRGREASSGRPVAVVYPPPMMKAIVATLEGGDMDLWLPAAPEMNVPKLAESVSYLEAPAGSRGSYEEAFFALSYGPGFLFSLSDRIKEWLPTASREEARELERALTSLRSLDADGLLRPRTSSSHTGMRLSFRAWIEPTDEARDLFARIDGILRRAPRGS